MTMTIINCHGLFSKKDVIEVTRFKNNDAGNVRIVHKEHDENTRRECCSWLSKEDVVALITALDPTAYEGPSAHSVHDLFKALEGVILALPGGKARACAITKLEEALFWASVAVAGKNSPLDVTDEDVNNLKSKESTDE